MYPTQLNFFAVWKFFEFVKVECPKTVYLSFHFFFQQKNLVVSRDVFRIQSNTYDGTFLPKKYYQFLAVNYSHKDTPL